MWLWCFFFFQAEDGIRDADVTGVQTCALPISDLVEPESKARLVELSGQVFTRSCRPVGQALVDLWHADERGQYANAGFRYRGHSFTDEEGRYRFRTILPALYTGRTRHYHVKVQAPRQNLLTTQRYFPDEPMNRRDGLFRRELLMRVAEAGDALAARLDCVLDMRQDALFRLRGRGWRNRGQSRRRSRSSTRS